MNDEMQTVSGNNNVDTTTLETEVVEDIIETDVSGNIPDNLDPQEVENNVVVDVSGNNVVLFDDITQDTENIETDTELLEKLDNIDTTLSSIELSCITLVFLLVVTYVLNKIERGVRRFKNNE